MPIPTPFHERTSRYCISLRWKDWAGYFIPNSYDTTHDYEYFAIRNGAGLIDVTPLFKYDVTGPDAAAFLSWVTVKNVHKMKTGQVTYTCWCDDDGKVIDDGTIWKFSDEKFRVTAAEPTLSWFQRFNRGFNVTLTDVSEKMGALALQGPKSRDILKAATDIDMDKIRYFRMAEGSLDGNPVTITRTGYTGDLGYEIWVENDKAVKVYDSLLSIGNSYGILPAGMEAMDVSRVEAGFIMNGVDYFSAHHCMIDARKSTPYEIGLGWTVNLKRDPFVGQAALRKEKELGPKKMMVGLDIDWDETEELYSEHGPPPQICNQPWRTSVPVYDFDGKQIGRATSGAWSPLLKKNLALASIDSRYAKPGTEVKFEMTVEFERKTVSATVTAMPFFNPERKRA